MCGHCSFPLGLGECKILFVPSKTGVSFFPPVLWKSYNQIPLAFNVRFPGDPQSLCCFPRLGSLTQNLHSSGRASLVLCFLVCGSPTQRVWDLILLCLHPSYHSLWLLLCLWTWSIIFLVGYSILLLMAVQQVVAILVLLHEEMSTCPSVPFLMEKPPFVDFLMTVILAILR